MIPATFHDIHEAIIDHHATRNSHCMFYLVDTLDPKFRSLNLPLPNGYTIACRHIAKNPERSFYILDRETGEYTKTSSFHLLSKQPVFFHIYRSTLRDRKLKISFEKHMDLWYEIVQTAEDPYCFYEVNNQNPQRFRNWKHEQLILSSNVCVRVRIEGVQFYILMPFEVAEELFGLQITEDLRLRISNGNEVPFSNYRNFLNLPKYMYRGHNYAWPKIGHFDFTLETVCGVSNHLGVNSQNCRNFVLGLFKKAQVPKLELDGIKKNYQRLEPLLDEVRNSDPFAFCAFRSLAAVSKLSIESVKMSGIFNSLFDGVNTKEQLIKTVRSFYCWNDKSDLISASSRFEESVKRTESYKTKRKAVLKSTSNRAISKLVDDFDSLNIDQDKHKRTWKEIEEGNLPIGTFFRKSEQYFVLNDNWDLWEEMFKRGYREQAIELANEVKGRTTYEKDLMSYFYFVLYALPKYLKKHTGYKWTCIPKIVNSSKELEPPEADNNGVVKTRSALTPIVDNDAKTVVVPYASLSIYGGRGTTYCYSHDYHVLHEGMSFNGYVVTTEVEKELNGRDDYGLMFYTLTGSAQGRGYPTFLIIFERRKRYGDTRVHFHRTHPCRSKNGDYNPIHNWIRVCYNWMIGNVNRNRIAAQQGNLAFVRIKTENDDQDLPCTKGLVFDQKVNKYDNHCFAEPVEFADYTKSQKSNILGYVRLEKETWLNHSEHENELIPAGTYALYECRSWEANPKGVWSLNID